MRRSLKSKASALAAPPFGYEIAEKIGLQPGEVSEIIGALLGAGAAAMIICSFGSGQKLPVIVPLQESLEATLAELICAHPIQLTLAVPSGRAETSRCAWMFAGVTFSIIEPGRAQAAMAALQPDASGTSAHIASA